MFGICEPIEALNELTLKARNGDAHSKELMDYIIALEHCRNNNKPIEQDSDLYCQDMINASEAF
jgi:hypothetical protein